jgi:hypothetical protein
VPSHPRRPIAQRTAQAKGVIGISLLAIDCPEYRQSTQEPFWASFFIILLGPPAFERRKMVRGTAVHCYRVASGHRRARGRH